MKTYDNHVQEMEKLLKERHVCLYSRKAHSRCYSELREYLNINKQEYSLKNARRWLMDLVKVTSSPSEFQAKWHYVEQLDELARTGAVLQNHLLLTKPNYEKLSKTWRTELDEYLDYKKMITLNVH